MSEFKFACPVCGQHITAAASAAGTQLECPTCFRKIVVPQAPTSAERKFILSAAEVNKPRLPQTAVTTAEAVAPSRKFWGPIPLAVLGLLVVAGAGTAAFFFLRPPGSKPTTEGPGQTQTQAAATRGAIGVGAWNTRVEFTNVVVKKGSETLYRSDFSTGSTGWQTHNGNWSTTGGVFRQTALVMDCRAIIGENSWRDYTITLRARKSGGREGFLVMFNVIDGANWTWWNIGGWDNSRHAVEACVHGRKSTLGATVSGRIDNNRWYDVRIVLKGRRVRCYLDEVLIHDVNYPAQTPAPSSG